jgi:tetratricopeptide (TPR) repeat protein
MKTTLRLVLLLALLTQLPLTGCSQPFAPAPDPQYKPLRDQGDAKADAGDPAAALALYQQARKLAPTNDLAILMRIADTATKLRQADVAGEAIAAMLRIDPKLKDDPDILALQAAMKSPAPAPASPPPAAPKLDARARLELDTLTEMGQKAAAAPGLEEQRQAYQNLFERTTPFVRDHPDITEAWLLRAVAAMATERARDGWEAGQKLLALGALDSTDPRLRSALVQLNSRKWLDKDPPFAFPQPGKPWENSLGMKFVPVPGTDVLFCVWETRVKDYAAYAAASSGVDRSWRNPEWQNVLVTSKDDCPVVNVSWEDAKAFCDWLTRKERAAGRLDTWQFYRLPTDLEWSAAVGLGRESGATPQERDEKIKDVYPWGTQWPPPAGAGNYADETSRAAFGTNWHYIAGYRDFHATTAPVGSFPANRFGIHDLGGNVWEWCEDWWNSEQKYRVLRGASWDDAHQDDLLSSDRDSGTPGNRYDDYGFRVVLVGGGSR